MEPWDIFFTVELFFAAVLIGMIVSLVVSYFFSFFSLKTEYELEIKWARLNDNKSDRDKFEFFNKSVSFYFWLYLIVILILIGILLYSFVTFAGVTNQLPNTKSVNQNTSVVCFNNTIQNNRYNVTVTQIIVNNKRPEFSIKELQDLISKKYPS